MSAPISPAPPSSVPAAVASVIGRDLRTPLHSMLGFLELLGMTKLDAEQRRTFEYVMTDADGMTRAADRLLLLCRLGAGEERGAARTFEVPELLGSVAAGVSAEVAVKIDRDVPGRLSGDENQLRLLLGELLDNAISHGRGPFVLRVSPAAPLGQSGPLDWSVLDSGGGLSAEQAAFLTSDPDVAPLPRSGFGLYLAKHLAAQLGGRLTTERPGPNQHVVTLRLTLSRPGAVVGVSVAADGVPAPADGVTVPADGVTVPADGVTAPADGLPAPADGVAVPGDPGADRFQPAAVAGPSDLSAHPTSLKVLLVEDNSVNLILAQRQLKLLGHELTSVTRGELGVRAALADEFDVILMDRHLPDLDGVQACLQIRAGETAAGRRPTPIVAVTADAMAQNREECLAAGMDAFLTKPVDLEDLRATLLAVAPVGGGPEQSEPVLDPSALQLLTEQLDAPELALELRHAFLAELPLRRLRLQGAVRRSAAADIIRTAEALRASSQTIGARRLAVACRLVAEAAGAGNTRLAHQRLDAVRESCQLTASALNSMPVDGLRSA